ncbi:hypothetical protein CC2G_011372 [Coprinopsis cinerea AmutBmut pab1-1]|nr:hypothetical protein CC2G_011372 [Coprinopsis cinerea AmutBmut pab1-1]
MKLKALSLVIAAFKAFKGFVPASAILIPGASTPLFFLVATGPVSEGDLFLPLRLTGWSNQATLTGDNVIGQFYMINNSLVAEDPVNGLSSPYVYRPYVDLSTKIGRDANGAYDASQNDPNDDCSATSGPLIFIQENRPDGIITVPPKCAKFNPFSLLPNPEDPQFGAKLVYNGNSTDFYSCGKGRNIYWKANPSDEPVDCNVPVQLFTIPVV